MNMTLEKLVVNGDSVTLTGQGQTAPLDEADKKRYQEQAYPFPEVNFGKAGYSLQVAPMLDNIDGKDAYVVTVTSPSGAVSKKYYDATTGFKLKDEISGEEGNAAFTYSDYKEVSGIMFPYTIETFQPADFTLKVTEVKVNSGLKEEDFKVL